MTQHDEDSEPSPEGPGTTALLDGMRRGDRVALGRAITLLESTRADHRTAAEKLLEAALPYSGASLRIGVTGVPGAGKSTFIEALGMSLLDATDRSIAVLAIDPSSRRSGGSILGDKTRMARLAAQPRAFIRPSPTGRTTGGVARRTREVILLCEAAGYDTVFVETVGVGQAETAVHSMVDFFLLLALAGAGDELQGIKRGIVEMADLVAISKADGDNLASAERARGQFASALKLFPPTDSGWEPPVRKYSAITHDGLQTIWDDIATYERRTRTSGYFETRRREQARYWLRETIDQRLVEALHRDPALGVMLADYEDRVLRHEVSTAGAAEAILKAYRSLGR